ncbi:MAG: cysteine hydrolase [Methylobacterium mesophilicum]|nr:cysteine hydrolase [Methylobacterium mesophilicum]
MNLSRATLLSIDMQQAFDNPTWPPRWNADVDRNGLALLAAWRETERPLIHVRHDSVEPGSTLRPGQPGNAFRPGFGPQGAEPVVAKSVNAAFIGTDLELRLRRLDIDTVAVFGITTDQCVSTTVRVGSNLGFRMILVEDACDCFALPDVQGGTIPAHDIHRAHVATLRAEFAQVATTAEMLDALRLFHAA